MAAAACSEERFIELFEKLGGATAVSNELGISVRNVHARKAALEAKFNIKLGWDARVKHHKEATEVHYDHPYDVAIFTDCHFWPNTLSPAFYIFCEALEAFQPEVLVCLGDAFDGARISRHPRRGWEQRPSLKEELDAVQEAMGLIGTSAKGADKHWCRGNHDDRFDNYLAANASEFEAVPGSRLADHFPSWEMSDLIMVNDTLACLHDWHSGVHGAFNNTLKAGVSVATGHTHRCHVREWTDYTGLRYGIEGGTLADIYGPQFAYTKMRPVNWQSGFVWVHVDGDTIYPERVIVNQDGKTRWRGKTWTGG